MAKDGFAPARRTVRRPGDPAQQNTTKPDPEAVYIGDLPRGPIGKLRRSLNKALPKWAVLNISFIGDSVTEILCHKPLVPRQVATVKLMKYRHLAKYDPTAAVGKDDNDSTTIQYRGSCYHRWQNAAKKSYSVVCKEWYTKQAESLMVRYPNIAQSKPFSKRTQPASNDAQAQPKDNNAQTTGQGQQNTTETEKEVDNSDNSDTNKEAAKNNDNDDQQQGHPAGDQL